MLNWNQKQKNPFYPPMTDFIEGELFAKFWYQMNDLLLQNKENRSSLTFSKDLFFELIFDKVIIAMTQMIHASTSVAKGYGYGGISQNKGFFENKAFWSYEDGTFPRIYFSRGMFGYYFSFNQWSLARHIVEAEKVWLFFPDAEEGTINKVDVSMMSFEEVLVKPLLEKTFGADYAPPYQIQSMLQKLEPRYDLFQLLSYFLHSFICFLWDDHDRPGERIRFINNSLGIPPDLHQPLLWSNNSIPETFKNRCYPYEKDNGWKALQNLIEYYPEREFRGYQTSHCKANIYAFHPHQYWDRFYIWVLTEQPGAEVLAKYISLAKNYFSSF